MKANGVFQVEKENILLLAPRDGYVLSVNLKNNRKVYKGSTLLTLDTGLVNFQEKQLARKEKNLNLQLADLQVLLKNIDSQNIKSSLSKANYQKFQVDFLSQQDALNQATKNYKRYAGLLQKKAISIAEFEAYEIHLLQMQNNLNSTIANYKLQLQMDVKSIWNELNELKLSRKLVESDRKNHSLLAPADGHIQDVIGLSVGTLIHINQRIGELAPDGDLIAKCYFNTKDIALITKGQLVNFQVDALAHGQWGTILGKVIEIDAEATVIHGTSFFKVSCKLSNQCVKLKNGSKRYIKKGMAFKATLKVGNRTLWRLLSDKSHDWLNDIKGQD